MKENARISFDFLWLTAPIVLLLAIAAGCGIFIHGLYRDVPNIVAQAIGQDLISLAIVLPTLVITAVLARRGSLPARLIWLGGLLYLVYTYLIFAFDIQYNQLFLVYVALLGCSLYGFIGSLARLDMSGIKSHSTGKAPIKLTCIYLAVVAILFYFMWLSEIVPAWLAGELPQSVQENGTQSHAVYVLDMAWILPAFVITSISLWRKHILGYTLAGPLLSYFVLIVLACLSMVALQAWDGQPMSVPQAVIFGTLFASGLGILVWYLRGIRSLRLEGEIR